MDYGKHLYKQKKIDQAHKKGQKQTEVKGVRLSLRTGEHDLQTKIKQAQRFLSKKNLVKFTLILKGREFAHQDLAFKKMAEVQEMLEEIADVDTPPKKQGNHLMMIISPKK
jgi:translation initiation factor IF-3